MLDIQSLVRQLNRPKLLVRAARFGLDEYRRGRTLRRLLDQGDNLRPDEALLQLMDVESDINDKRIARSAEYSIAEHIDYLTAIMGETRLHAETLARPEDS